LWRTAQSGLSTIQQELEATIQLELWAAQEQLEPPAEVIDEQATTAWQQRFEQEFVQLNTILRTNTPKVRRIVDVQVTALQGEVALIQMVTKSEEGGQVYRQSRFYRRTAAGWKRTTPLENLWGTPSSLESRYFVFHFRRRDAETVAQVAPELDKLYVTLSQHFGQPHPSQQGKLPIEISVMYRPEQAFMSLSDPFSIPSPALYLAPSEVTDEQLLAQSMALALVNSMLGQVSILRAWQPMLDGLRLWQLWDLQLPLSTWQDEIVAWVYRDALAIEANNPIILPEWHLPLCIMHGLWLHSLVQLRIPLLCYGANRSDWEVYLRYLRMPITHLAQLGVPAVWPDERPDLQAVMLDSSRPGQAVAIATLIDYAVSAYGRDRLPLFIKGLGQYDSWESLVPAVFGVSHSAFENGWRVYLVTPGAMDEIR
jgi:hypothetical protein